VNLDALIPPGVLAVALEQGYVRKQVHPELPLAILNYTERAAYAGVWNEATLQCRGLIYDERDRYVLARPFPKFFNYGQPGAPELDLDAPAVVTERAFAEIVRQLEYDGFVYPGGADGILENGFTTAPAPPAREWSRKDFALLAKDHPYAWALFQRLDRRDYRPKLWHLNRPEPETPTGRVYTEDVA